MYFPVVAALGGLNDAKIRQQYVPYIADAMIQQNDSTYYDVNGILIYDPSIG